jgi:hypothetical protein
MKKILLSVLFLAVFSPLFAQTSKHYEKFQGIWYGTIYGEDKVVFIFIDDIFICNLDGGFSYKYNIEGQNLVLKEGRKLWISSGWVDAANNIGKIQYIFSGDRLLLIFDGEPIALSRDYSDFPSWR